MLWSVASGVMFGYLFHPDQIFEACVFASIGKLLVCATFDEFETVYQTLVARAFLEKGYKWSKATDAIRKLQTRCNFWVC